MFYLKDVWVRGRLFGVTLETPKRGVVALVGPNGSGKTTLLRVMAGLLKPDRGEVRRPAKVGSSWQNPYYSFCKPTVLEDVAEVVGGREKAEELLARLGMLHLASRSPFTLSAGQARLLSVALATAWGPDAVLVDEPTTGLGYKERAAVSKLFKELGEEKLVVVASHDVEFVLEVADAVAVLLGGKVLEYGDALEVIYGSGALWSALGFPKPCVVKLGEALGVRLRSASDVLAAGR